MIFSPFAIRKKTLSSFELLSLICMILHFQLTFKLFRQAKLILNFENNSESFLAIIELFAHFEVMLMAFRLSICLWVVLRNGLLRLYLCSTIYDAFQL